MENKYSLECKGLFAEFMLYRFVQSDWKPVSSAPDVEKVQCIPMSHFRTSKSCRQSEFEDKDISGKVVNPWLVTDHIKCSYINLFLKTRLIKENVSTFKKILLPNGNQVAKMNWNV